MITLRRMGRAHGPHGAGRGGRQVWGPEPGAGQDAETGRDPRSRCSYRPTPTLGRPRGPRDDPGGDEVPHQLASLMQVRHGDLAPAGRCSGTTTLLGHDRPYPVDEYVEHVRAARGSSTVDVQRAYGNYRTRTGISRLDTETAPPPTHLARAGRGFSLGGKRVPGWRGSSRAMLGGRGWRGARPGRSRGGRCGSVSSTRWTWRTGTTPPVRPSGWTTPSPRVTRIDHYTRPQHAATARRSEPVPRRAEPAHPRVRLGALVNVLPAHDRCGLAEEVACWTGSPAGAGRGRVGSGVSPYELAQFGVAAEQAKAVYAEALEHSPRLGGPAAAHRGTCCAATTPPCRRCGTAAVSRRSGMPPAHRTAQWAGRHGVNFRGTVERRRATDAVEGYWSAWRAGARAGPAERHVRTTVGWPRRGDRPHRAEARRLSCGRTRCSAAS